MSLIEYENLRLLNKEFEDSYKLAFEEFLQSGWYILGEGVKTFEEAYATYCGTQNAVGVASGLDALILSLKVLNFPKGSEIIVPSNTYIASILAIIHADLVPILVEPDINTYNIDPYKIEEKITLKTKAILVVHMYGKPCDMDEVKTIAKNNFLAIVEDCAQAHGAKYKGVKCGALGDLGAHSFYPTKNLGGLGDGGAITFTNEEYNEKLRALRNYGSKIKYHNDYVGWNSRLDEIQAYFLKIKLSKLDIINSHKKELASIYFNYLDPNLILPSQTPHTEDVFHIFAVRLNERDKLREFLLQNGVKTEIHYPIPPHKQKAMVDIISVGDYSVSEKIHSTILSLPISYYHSRDDIFRVVEVVNKFFLKK